MLINSAEKADWFACKFFLNSMVYSCLIFLLNIHLPPSIFSANISNVNSEKACGPHDIHVIVISECASELVPDFSKLCNKCIATTYISLCLVIIIGYSSLSDL